MTTCAPGWRLMGYGKCCHYMREDGADIASLCGAYRASRSGFGTTQAPLECPIEQGKCLRCLKILAKETRL